jgi:DNA-binding MarR family transcriptional regulator
MSEAPTLLCACASLRRASRAVTQLYESAFRGSGLRATQFTLLQVLERRGEMMQSQLGDILALNTTTLTRTLLPLRNRGWIRVREGADRRERYWSLTPRGKSQVERVRGRWLEAQRRLQQRIGPERWEELLETLARVAGSARSDESAAVHPQT